MRRLKQAKARRRVNAPQWTVKKKKTERETRTPLVKGVNGTGYSRSRTCHSTGLN